MIAKVWLFNYSSPAGSDSKSDCWRATLCPKVKYVGSAQLFEQSMQIYIDRQFIHCFFFFISYSIIILPLIQQKNPVVSAKSKFLKKSSSSFIWLSFESHHAPDTAAAEWNLNNSCPLQKTFGIQKMLNISLGLREMQIKEFRF